MAQPAWALGKTVISGSGAVTSTNATDNLRTSTTYTNAQIPASSAITAFCNWTANTGTGGTNYAFVELQTSPNGGTTWLTVLRFAQITTSSGTIMVNFRSDGIGGNEAASNTGVVSSTTASVISNVALTADQRWLWTISSGQSLTFSVFANVMPPNSRVQC